MLVPPFLLTLLCAVLHCGNIKIRSADRPRARDAAVRKSPSVRTSYAPIVFAVVCRRCALRTGRIACRSGGRLPDAADPACCRLCAGRRDRRRGAPDHRRTRQGTRTADLRREHRGRERPAGVAEHRGFHAGRLQLADGGKCHRHSSRLQGHDADLRSGHATGADRSRGAFAARALRRRKSARQYRRRTDRAVAQDGKETGLRVGRQRLGGTASLGSRQGRRQARSNRRSLSRRRARDGRHNLKPGRRDHGFDPGGAAAGREQAHQGARGYRQEALTRATERADAGGSRHQARRRRPSVLVCRVCTEGPAGGHQEQAGEGDRKDRHLAGRA